MMNMKILGWTTLAYVHTIQIDFFKWSMGMRQIDNGEPYIILEGYLTIGMAGILDILIILFARVSPAVEIFILNIIIIALVLGISWLSRRFPLPLIQFVRDWGVLAFLIIFYFEQRTLIPLVNPHDLDSLFITIDQFIFAGHNPTVLMERITYPVLSEILQISYASFFFMPFTLCVILYFFRETKRDFHIAASIILMGFFCSYLGYYLTPVLGPRYSMEQLHSFPLTGLWTFDFIRNYLAQSEGVMRDCCPSGHTMIALLTILLAWRYAKRFFPIALVWGLLIIFSTVYLRYHYVFDLIAGILLGLLVYWYGHGIAQRFATISSQTHDDPGMVPFRQEQCH